MKKILSSLLVFSFFLFVFGYVANHNIVSANGNPAQCVVSMTNGTTPNTVNVSLTIYPTSTGTTRDELITAIEAEFDGLIQLDVTDATGALIDNRVLSFNDCAISQSGLVNCQISQTVTVPSTVVGQTISVLVSDSAIQACTSTLLVANPPDPNAPPQQPAPTAVPPRQNFGQGDNFGVNRQTLNALNPLKQLGNEGVTGPLNTPGAVLSRFLTNYAFPIAGLILFIMLIWGGFEILSGASTKKSMDAGKQRIQAALIGFLLLFVSYWLVQLIEYVFNVNIL